MSDITQVLAKIQSGDQQATGELFPLVYEELRKLAASRMSSERSDHTLQATALVHEAYVRLVDTDQVQGWNSRGHFLSAAAEAMRRILVDASRAKMRAKRGGEFRRIEFEDFEELTNGVSSEQLLELDEALTKLEMEDPGVADLVRLRLFAGLSTSEAAKALRISRSTAYKYLEFAMAWFSTEMA